MIESRQPKQQQQSMESLMKELRQLVAKLPGGRPLDPPELPHTPVVTRRIIEKDDRTPDQIKADNFLREQQITLGDFLGVFATCIWSFIDWDWSLPKKPPEELTKK